MKKMDWVIFGVVAALLLGLANQAENLLPSSFDAGKFVPSVVERRDNIYGVCTVGDRVIWMAGTNGKIVRSEDGGKTWSEQESGVREHFQDIAAWDELRAVAVGNGGVIVITEDGGKTWKAVESLPAERGRSGSWAPLWGPRTMVPRGHAWFRRRTSGGTGSTSVMICAAGSSANTAG